MSVMDLAENGEIAIKKIIKNDYDLVLMDIQMPIMDGNEATRYIRENLGVKSSIPIIALTAHATLGEEQKCLEVGMDDYLSKPFDSQKLLEKIHNNLFKSDTKSEIVGIEDNSTSVNSDFFDFSYLYEVADNDEEFVQEMVQLFLTNVPISTDQIILCVKNRDIENLKKELHKLKSSLGLLGLDEGFKIAVKIEDALNKEIQIDELELQFHSLLNICDIVIKQLTKMKTK
jgi:CheY-like chemotaxis protein